MPYGFNGNDPDAPFQRHRDFLGRATAAVPKRERYEQVALGIKAANEVTASRHRVLPGQAPMRPHRVGDDRKVSGAGGDAPGLD